MMVVSLRLVSSLIFILFHVLKPCLEIARLPAPKATATLIMCLDSGRERTEAK